MKYIEMMSKERSTKILNFMTHGAGVLVLGHSHISHVVNMYYILLYQYTADYLKVIMPLSSVIVNFYLFFYLTVDVEI